MKEFSFQITPFIIGCVISLFGWTLYWAGLNLTGAIVGASFGATITLIIDIIFNFKDSTFITILLVLSIAGIFAGMFLFKRIHKFFFFLFGASLGILLSEMIIKIIETHKILNIKNLSSQILFKIMCALIIGILVVFLSKYIITIVTSIIGTYLILFSMNNFYFEYLVIPIFIFSILIQTGFIKYLKIEKKGFL